MHKVILFRGGMCGDIVLAMLDKNYVRSIYPKLLNRDRYVMKKFYNFSHAEKIQYFKKMSGHTLTHDTDFCHTLPVDNVIQIHCSDNAILEKLADRFWTKNESHAVDHVRKDLKLSEQYTLADDFRAWQQHHVFEHRLDVAQIYKKDFPDYLHSIVGVKDIEWARTMHELWSIKNSNTIIGKYMLYYDH